MSKKSKGSRLTKAGTEKPAKPPKGTATGRIAARAGSGPIASAAGPSSSAPPRLRPAAAQNKATLTSSAALAAATKAGAPPASPGGPASRGSSGPGKAARTGPSGSPRASASTTIKSDGAASRGRGQEVGKPAADKPAAPAVKAAGQIPDRAPAPKKEPEAAKRFAEAVKAGPGTPKPTIDVPKSENRPAEAGKAVPEPAKAPAQPAKAAADAPKPAEAAKVVAQSPARPVVTEAARTPPPPAVAGSRPAAEPSRSLQTPKSITPEPVRPTEVSKAPEPSARPPAAPKSGVEAARRPVEIGRSSVPTPSAPPVRQDNGSAGSGKPAAVGPAAPAPAALVANPRRILDDAAQAGERFREAAARHAATGGGSLVEINAEILDLMRSQGEAAMAYWQSFVTARSLPEAMRLQTAALRQAYEASAAHWSAIAAKTGRYMGEIARPFPGWPGGSR